MAAGEPQKRCLPGALNGGYVPGYLGYRPQMKFYYGKTYGALTRNLSKLQGMTEVDGDYLDKHVRFSEGVLPEWKRKLEPPPAGGNSKFTSDMVSSYSGCIPGFNFKFGATYQEAAKDAIQDYMAARQNTHDTHKGLQQTVNSQSSLTPCQSQALPYVSSYRLPRTLKHYNLDVPPISGYMGWVPRYEHCGLGKTHTLRSKEALEMFNREQELHRTRNPDVTTTEQKIQQTKAAGELKMLMSRHYPVYRKSGVIPNYTGHIPKHMFEIGSTYGSSARRMSVCKHSTVD